MKLVFIGFISLLLIACQTTTDNNNEQLEYASQAILKPSLNDEKDAEAAQDLWVRIVEQFTMKIPDDPSIEYYRNWYLKHPQHLNAISERAKPFLYYIVKRLEQEDMPMELALLPAVESAFDPHAYSYSSAAGLWQFIPSTGDTYGLKRNYWYDGRRDVVDSTNAALEYLSYLNRFFDGNWDHAIAAYNSGEGRVRRAIRKNESQGKATDFFSLDLPEETRGYLPKLLALADVIMNQKEYGVDIPDIPNKPVLMRVDPKKQLSLDSVARYTGVSVDDLKRYNAGLNRSATPPSGPYHLLIPIGMEEQFYAAASSDNSPQIQVAQYQVRAGDSLSGIAQKFSTTVAEVKRINKLSNNNIKIGQQLNIPEQLTNTTTKVSTKKVNTNIDKQTASRPAASAPVTAPQNTRTMYYQVRRGETLSHVAQKYKVNISDIMSWNQLTDQTVRAGQKLKLLISMN